MINDIWVQTDDFAARVGISRQAAGCAVRSAMKGQMWRGHQLEVRRRLGRGGRSGLVYEVRLASIPGTATLTSPPEVDTALCTTGRSVRHDDAQVLQRLSILEPALRAPPSSAARSEAVQLAVVASGVSARTLYRWIDQYQQHGVRGLARARPSNAGQTRVAVSRAFDRAWRAHGHDEPSLAAVAAQLTGAIKGLWASRAEQAGSAEVRRLAEFQLQEICEGKGVKLPREAFRLSRRYVERFAHYRVVNQRRNDRKAFDDAKPRIRRDWTSLAPMERVVADVKHLDVVVSRPDGTRAWPKIVAMMDAGTGRVFVHPVLLPAGEGVRQEHVIEAFLAMVAHPAWGFPQGLYLDNGAEFGALLKIDRALELLNDPGARTIIHARPYNASAKPIESLFARLDRYVFSALPGYAGPSRMAQKTQTVGRPPQPFPGSWDDFCETLQQLIKTYNHRPIGGLWLDRSPHDWFQEKVEAGWGPARADGCALDAAFSDADSRRVDRGVLKINGRRYTHERLAALPHRTIVDIALPWRRESPPLAKLAGVWVYLSVDAPYPARWIEGARESRRRQTNQAQYVRSLAKDAPTIDPVAIKVRMAQRLRDVHPAGPEPKLDLGGEIHGRAAAARSARDDPSPPSAAEQRRARERALTERLERAQGRHD